MGITLWQSLSGRAEKLARDAFNDVHTIDEWTRMRGSRHDEFMRALGLSPFPPQCDSKVTEYGSFGGDGFHAKKIAFQILPDCWNSACIYYPEPAQAEPAPCVLYVCGHWPIGTWCGQYHPIMWARRGYVCMIIDTIEQNDNPGEHHGSYMGKLDAWLSMGYTPAGTEVLNAMRALDVLCADEKVDSERIGITGVSGGGAYSFHTAIVDERIEAVSTLCGISSSLDAITNQHISSHCDCMYPHNVYGRDISEYAALIAPRAALFCFADNDSLYHPEQTRALVDRTKRVYDLYEKSDLCKIVTCAGAHGDHPEFDEATSKWFDKYVAGNERPIIERGEPECPESVTCVFNGQPPSPNHLHLLPSLISSRGTVALPAKSEDWPNIRDAAIQRLRNEIFDAQSRSKIESSISLDGEWHIPPPDNEMIHCAHRGQIEGLDVSMEMFLPLSEPSKLFLRIASEGETSLNALNYICCLVDSTKHTCVGFQPRVAGNNSPVQLKHDGPPGARGNSSRTLLVKAMSLIGTTPVMMTIEDIGVITDYISNLPEINKPEIYLCGKGDSGVAALYYALTDDRISGVVLEEIPSSHLDGSPILGILRELDIPQAVGLMAPRKVGIVTPGHSFWTWPERAYERIGLPGNFLRTHSMNEALDMLLG